MCFCSCKQSSEAAASRRRQAEGAVSNIAVLKAIINDHDNLDIQNVGPSGIEKSHVYYVDMCGKSLLDVTIDGTGSWKNDGTFRWHYKHEGNSFKCIREKYRRPIPRGDLTKGVYVLVKTYYKRVEENSTIKRCVMHIESSRQPYVNNICAIGYIFSHETLLHPKKHGNSTKNPNSYTRVKPVAINNVLNLTQNMTVTQAVETHISQNGVRDTILPEMRPSKQSIYNKRTSKDGNADDFEAVLEYARENPGLVRDVQALPDPYLILATEQQLRDMRRFCTGMYD